MVLKKLQTHSYQPMTKKNKENDGGNHTKAAPTELSKLLVSTRRIIRVNFSRVKFKNTRALFICKLRRNSCVFVLGTQHMNPNFIAVIEF